MDWIHLPISDGAVPDGGFEAAWNLAGEGLRARLRSGADILVHCKGGLGRAGTIAARLQVELGTDPEVAIACVRAARSPAAIENASQEHHVRSIACQPEPAPAIDRSAISDRAIGALLGLAVGDAIGTTLEFAPRDDRATPLTDMVGGGPFGLEPGQWTDDTAMALALADSLTDADDFDELDLLRRFQQWWRKGTYSCTGRCFDIGNATRQALARFERTGERHCGATRSEPAGRMAPFRPLPIWSRRGSWTC